MKKYLIITSLSILSITIIVVAGLYFYFQRPLEAKEAGAISVDELVEHSLDTEEITTNLKDQGIVRVSFRIQLDSKKAKEELEKRVFQLNNAIIYELAGTTNVEIQGQQGIDLLEQKIAERVDEFLEHGKVVRVFTTQKIIQ